VVTKLFASRTSDAIDIDAYTDADADLMEAEGLKRPCESLARERNAT